mmetsp:Transcript_36293/g.82721  ORF Transcript_36293/g.82721 Transcript_36293/m.82721 type:complete len:462 (+) Transcript_36293:4-1389(+)
MALRSLSALLHPRLRPATCHLNVSQGRAFPSSVLRASVGLRPACHIHFKRIGPLAGNSCLSLGAAGRSTAFARYARSVGRGLTTDAAAAAVNPGQRAVGRWLVVCSGMVFAMVVLGGVTRLTKSGLSMVTWKPTSIKPPMTQEEWEAEFEMYKQFPEYQRKNQNMTVEEFKQIYFMEWLHRVWGRAIGGVFAVPLCYFAARGYLAKPMLGKLCGIFLLGGLQGGMGWYMVKSGLDLPEGAEPRVSPYRLCAHLLAAFGIYSLTTWTAMDLLRQPATLASTVAEHSKTLQRSRHLALLTTGIVALTVVSGAFVAGNDAGRAYPEWPLMGGHFFPEEYWDEAMGYRNLFENVAAVQFDHRMLAYTTIGAIAVMFVHTRRPGHSAATRRAAHALAGMVGVQATLGITTLLHNVPVALAACHQAGSLVLLTFSLWLLHTLRLAAPQAARRVAVGTRTAATPRSPP